MGKINILAGIRTYKVLFLDKMFSDYCFYHHTLLQSYFQ